MCGCIRLQLRACMCGGASVAASVCVYVSVHVCLCDSESPCLCVSASLCVCVCLRVRLVHSLCDYAHVSVSCVSVYVCLCLCAVVSVRFCVCLSVCLSVCICLCLHMSVFANVCVCVSLPEWVGPSLYTTKMAFLRSKKSRNSRSDSKTFFQNCGAGNTKSRIANLKPILSKLFGLGKESVICAATQASLWHGHTENQAHGKHKNNSLNYGACSTGGKGVCL